MLKLICYKNQDLVSSLYQKQNSKRIKLPNKGAGIKSQF